MDLTQIPNAVYYTISTISQTMAAALALIASFAIFRISRWDEVVDECVEFLAEHALNDRIQRAIHEDNHVHILEEWQRQTEEATNPGVTLYNENLFKRRLYERALENVEGIRGALKASMVKTGIFVLFSIVFLFLAPFYLQSLPAVFAITGAGFVGMLVSAGSLWKVVQKCI